MTAPPSSIRNGDDRTTRICNIKIRGVFREYEVGSHERFKDCRSRVFRRSGGNW